MPEDWTPLQPPMDAEECWNLVVQHVRDYAIFMMDAQGRVASWNVGAERLLGYAEAEILGREAALFFTPEDRAAGLPGRELQTAAEAGVAQDENWAVRKDGSHFWASGVSTALRRPDGALRGFVKILRDRTERHDREQELEQRVRERTVELQESWEHILQSERLAAIRRTVAGLAHESRNAIQRGYTYLDRLRWRLQDQPEAIELVGQLQQAQDELLRLYEDVRGYAVSIQLDQRPCDLAQVWQAAWAELAPARQGRDARLEERTGGLDLTCEADPDRLRQVFRNLFDNALVACTDPAVITVTCSEVGVAGGGGGGVQVAVRDNGPGFNPRQRENLFEPFYTTRTQGTGLGLAVCRRLVEAHRGQISVGEASGTGAEVVLLLPRNRA